MMQLPLFQQPTLWTVSDITRYLRNLFESDMVLQDVWLQGEVSNLSRPGSGHVYFTLKDSSCALGCVIWRNAVLRQNYLPREGEAVEVHGNINIYETQGKYQLYVDLIRPGGEGALYQEFLRLKARLDAEGLFEPERKRAIPRWPRRIGIVTSPTGAALRDMLNTIRRRYPLVEIVLAPTQVQGIEAPAGVVGALDSLCQLTPCPDVILVARGGGSIEDLWAFNDERVARAIAASPVPIISGVGHETDFTIADFVADLRAPTPTAAAELCTPNRLDLQAGLSELSARLIRAMFGVIESERWKAQRLEDRLQLRSPASRIRSERQRLDELNHRSLTAIEHELALQRAHLQGLQHRLEALSPLAVLARGYSIVRRADGRLVRRINQVNTGDSIQVLVTDGQIEAQVERITEEKR